MTTYYIAPSPTGNDSTGNGSNATPWATISKAHTSASSGDIIISKDGTYTWASQTFTKSLTIQAQNTRLAVFDGAAAVIQWYFQSDCTISGFRFTNSTTDASNPVFRAELALTATFISCFFDSITIYGIADGGQGGLMGNQLGGSGNTTFVLITCAIRDVYTIAGATDGYLFGARLSNGTRIATFSLTSCILYFANSTSQRIKEIWFKSQFANAGANVVITVKNCIIFNNTGQTINYSSGTGITSTLSYSCFRNITGTPSGTALITSDPLFYDPANSDFNLRPTSPAYNTGTLV